MSGFKDRAARDIRKVFLNLDKFAEERVIIYDGVTYDCPWTASDGGALPLPQPPQEPAAEESISSTERQGIPIILTGPVEKEREQLKDDHVQGLHLVTHTLYCAREDLGGKLPEQGKSLRINTRKGGKFFRKYYIAASADEMGMLRIELEEVDD